MSVAVGEENAARKPFGGRFIVQFAVSAARCIA
jgi:hypothetical protein